jgi:hypothetical protein
MFSEKYLKNNSDTPTDVLLPCLETIAMKTPKHRNSNPLQWTLFDANRGTSIAKLATIKLNKSFFVYMISGHEI